MVKENATIVNFFKKTLNDGRNVDCVKIYVAGDPGNSAEGLARDYKDQYPVEWNNYINNRPESDGTPLTEFRFKDEKLSIASIASLNNIGIFTIEQLASIPSNFMFKIGFSAKEIVAEAKKFVESNIAKEQEVEGIQKIKKEVLSSLSKEDIIEALKQKEAVENPIQDAPISEEVNESVKKKGRPAKQK